MELKKGIINRAKKVLIYGPEGIGKTTFASGFPNPVFIDTESGTEGYDLMRVTPSPSSWAMLMEYAGKFTQPGLLELSKTLVIDTLDWAERLCVEHVCAEHKVSGIEDFGYGKGYTYVYEEFGKFFNKLQDVIKNGINVVAVAHAATKKIEAPEEATPYDSWGLKLSKGCVGLAQEWADMILFANYKIFVVKNSEKEKKGKAQGGRRVMYATHHPCWVAKNRFGLADEMDFNYISIAHIIEGGQAVAPTIPEAAARLDNDAFEEAAPNASPFSGSLEDGYEPLVRGSQQEKEVIAAFPPPIPEQQQMQDPPFTQINTAADTTALTNVRPSHLLKLSDLMTDAGFLAPELQSAVALRGYFPADTPIENYPADFVEGVLLAAWPQVKQLILNAREGGIAS